MAIWPLKDGSKAIDQMTREVRRRAVRALVSSAERGRQVIVSQIIPSRSPQPVDRGVYRAGWRSGAIAGGAEIWNGEAHASLIEKGVRAANVKIGKAMIGALSKWALRKGLASDPEEAVHVAWAIAKAMRRRGIFGQSGLRVLEELMKVHMPKIVQAEFKRELSG